MVGGWAEAAMPERTTRTARTRSRRTGSGRNGGMVYLAGNGGIVASRSHRSLALQQGIPFETSPPGPLSTAWRGGKKKAKLSRAFPLSSSAGEGARGEVSKGRPPHRQSPSEPAPRTPSRPYRRLGRLQKRRSHAVQEVANAGQ